MNQLQFFSLSRTATERNATQKTPSKEKFRRFAMRRPIKKNLDNKNIAMTVHPTRQQEIGSFSLSFFVFILILIYF